MHSEIELKREVEAIQIPSGDTVVLPLGLRVIITQSLGGTYTVATDHGLARISAKDADALGLDLTTKTKKSEAYGESPLTGTELENAIWEQLKSVYDPEIPVNIVDLGLVYDMLPEPGADGGTSVTVKMTLTAPGCGMGPTIAADAQSRLLTIPGVDEARVDLVWDPPWNQEMISLEGKMKLGMV
ncbi:MAG: putative Fe-S cluster assembly protein SufT [Verrucomicrobiales bacterium]